MDDIIGIDDIVGPFYPGKEASSEEDSEEDEEDHIRDVYYRDKFRLW